MDDDHSDRSVRAPWLTWIALGSAYGLTVITESADTADATPRTVMVGLMLALIAVAVVLPGARQPAGPLVRGGLVVLCGTAVVLLGAAIVGLVGNGVGSAVVCLGAAAGLKGVAMRHATTQSRTSDVAFALVATGLLVAAVRDDAIIGTTLVVWLWLILSRRGAALRRPRPSVGIGADRPPPQPETHLDPDELGRRS
jgi:hypothetical protein